MARQSLQWANWIVVDDGTVSTNCTLGQRHIRLTPGLPPSASFARNLRIGLEQANRPDSEFVFFIEDDDWYGPHYLMSLLIALVSHDIAGESYARYFNVSERSYRYCYNAHHAALCSTAFRAVLIPQIIPLIADTDVYLDRRIWWDVDGRKHLQRTHHCVGLKGQDGRPGLAWGHRSCEAHGFRPDPDGMVLKQWIGDDAKEVLKHAIRPSIRPQTCR